MRISDFPRKLQLALGRVCNKRANGLFFGHILDQQRGFFMFEGFGIGDSLVKAMTYDETGKWNAYGEEDYKKACAELFGTTEEQAIALKAVDMGLDGCDDELASEICGLFGQDPTKPPYLSSPWKPENGFELWKRHKREKEMGGDPDDHPIYDEHLDKALEHHERLAKLNDIRTPTQIERSAPPLPTERGQGR